MEDPSITRARILAQCMAYAAFDQACALWLAGWYEANEPWLFVNLQAKVRQEIARGSRKEAKAAQ